MAGTDIQKIEVVLIEDLALHEAAAVVPPIAPELYEDIREDIEAHGIKTPLDVLPDGRILDGRHRYKIAGEGGIDSLPVIYRDLGEQEAVEFIVRASSLRRDLNAGQRATMWLKLDDYVKNLERRGKQKQIDAGARGEEGGRGRTKTLGALVPQGFSPKREPRTRDVLASAAGVCARTIQQAVRVKKKSPPRFEAVHNGEIALTRAIQELKQEELEEKIASQRKTGEHTPEFIQIDALRLIETTGERSVDLLLTDPPYSTDIEDIESFVDGWLYPALDTVKDTGKAFICTGPYPGEIEAYLSRLLRYERLHFGNILAWVYRNTLGPVPKHKFKNTWQTIFYLYGSAAAPLDSPKMVEQTSSIEIAAPGALHDQRHHAWQKPYALAERLVRVASAPEDFVFDPFCGTGTFCLAASSLGRRSLGGDTSPEVLAIFEGRGGVRREP